jgi:phenylalanine-4-hydroxylase
VTLRDFGALYDRLASASDLAIAEITSADRVITTGTQAYANAGGRRGSAAG